MALAYDRPRIILGEGKTDGVVFRRLIEALKLTTFKADYVYFKSQQGGGASQIGKYLRSMKVNETVRNVKLIVVAGDNDTEDSFKYIQDQVSQGGYSVPTEQKEIVETNNLPNLTILMIPSATHGCIESLCYEAAMEKWPDLKSPLTEYLDKTPAAGWPANKRDKMLTQCVLASTCENYPDVALKDLWHKKEEFHLPLDGQAFKDLADYLISFEKGDAGPSPE